jgi:hypothetical protein
MGFVNFVPQGPLGTNGEHVPLLPIRDAHTEGDMLVHFPRE